MTGVEIGGGVIAAALAEGSVVDHLLASEALLEVLEADLAVEVDSVADRHLGSAARLAALAGALAVDHHPASVALLAVLEADSAAAQKIAQVVLQR